MLRRLRREGYVTYECYHSHILDLYKFKPKQKYLAYKSDSSESDESDDDVSDYGDEEDYGVQAFNPYSPDTPDTPDLETHNQSLDLVSQLDYVFAASVPAPLSAKEDRAYFVGLSFNGKDEQGETACDMCGKSFKGINIHRPACRKKMGKMFNCMKFRTILLMCLSIRLSVILT